jgi:hypothetical protein
MLKARSGRLVVDFTEARPKDAEDDWKARTARASLAWVP